MQDLLSRLAWRSPSTHERHDEGLPSWRRHGWQAYLLAEPPGRPGLEVWLHDRRDRAIPADLLPPFVLPNVWMGVTVENRRFVHRADLLRQTPAAVRFISAEPLLGPLLASDKGEQLVDHGTGREGYAYWEDGRPVDDAHAELDLTGIDWLIAGGESGPRHRPIRPGWVRDLRDACQAAGTAYFFKQWGGYTSKAGGRELDGRTWDELPETPVGPA